jgi:hypothetical protein
VVVAYGLFVSGLALVIPMPSDNPYLIGGLVFVIAILLNPLRNRLQTVVDGTFFRGQRAYEDRIRTFSHELTGARDIEAIGRVIRQQVMSTLMPERLHVYTYDALNDQYAAIYGDDGRPTSDIRFASTSPLVQYFQQENIPLYLDTLNPPAILKGDEARLSLLGARLYIALKGRKNPSAGLRWARPFPALHTHPRISITWKASATRHPWRSPACRRSSTSNAACRR